MTPTLATPKIISAERLDGGVVIAFDDGKTAVYSAFLLYAHFAEARELPYEEEEG